MKKIKILLISVIALLLVGCGYEETKEYELLTVRRYSETEESGLFTTKKDTEWYIEYTYQTEDGVQKEDFNEICTHLLNIGEENKVVLEKGDFEPTLYITIEKYEKLYGIIEQ